MSTRGRSEISPSKKSKDCREMLGIDNLKEKEINGEKPREE
jgi:hypothetical protein